MHPEELIQVLYDDSPDIFQERFEVLDYLLATSGTGIIWKGGEMIFRKNNPELPIHDLINGKAHQYTLSHRYDKCLRRDRPRRLQRIFSQQPNPITIIVPSNINKNWDEIVDEYMYSIIEDGYIVILKRELDYEDHRSWLYDNS